MINTELMAKVRAIIEQHPSRHRQASWVANAFDITMFRSTDPRPIEDLTGLAVTDMPDTPANREDPICGTTACVAGWAAILAAPKGALLNTFDIVIPGEIVDGKQTYLHGSISAYAQDRLGLTDSQATWLFSGYRKREEILNALAWLPDHQDATYDALEAFEIPGAPGTRTTDMEFTEEQLKEAREELTRRDREQSRKYQEEYDRKQREAEKRHWLKMEAAYPGIDHDTLYSIYSDMRDFYE
jgi:hypothetical protein